LSRAPEPRGRKTLWNGKVARDRVSQDRILLKPSKDSRRTILVPVPSEPVRRELRSHRWRRHAPIPLIRVRPSPPRPPQLVLLVHVPIIVVSPLPLRDDPFLGDGDLPVVSDGAPLKLFGRFGDGGGVVAGVESFAKVGQVEIEVEFDLDRKQPKKDDQHRSMMLRRDERKGRELTIEYMSRSSSDSLNAVILLSIASLPLSSKPDSSSSIRANAMACCRSFSILSGLQAPSGASFGRAVKGESLREA
jgi:hypothetical protein